MKPIAFFILICICLISSGLQAQTNSSSSSNWVLRVPGLNLEYHTNNLTIDYRDNGGNHFYAKMDSSQISYIGAITSTVYSDPKDYPGDINNTYINSNGQIIIDCLWNPNKVCFTAYTLAATQPDLYLNDYYIVSQQKLIKGELLNVTPFAGNKYEIKLTTDIRTISNYNPGRFVPCDNAHTFCGDLHGITQIGNSYVVQCWPSQNICVSINIDSAKDN